MPRHATDAFQPILHARLSLRLLLTTAIVGVCAAIRLALDPLLGPNLQFSIFYGAVVTAAFLCGTGPAVLSIFLSVLVADFWFVGEKNRLEFDSRTIAGEILFLMVSLAFVGTVHALRRSEESLREKEERLRATFNQAAVGIAVASLEGRFLELNRKFAEILGYPEEELKQMTFVDITHPEDLESTRRNVRRLMEGAVEDYSQEKRYLRKDGREIWSQTTVTLLRDRSGQPTRFVGVIKDITDRKKTEEALRRREEELRAMADSIPQLAWMAEPDGHIFWYNRRWYEYTGMKPEQVEGWGWQSAHDPAILPKVLEAWKESIRTGTPFEMEFPLRRADGRFRWFLTRVLPLRDASGRVLRWFGTNTDVDQVKQAEQALRDETRALELLNKAGAAFASNLDLQSLVQTVTDYGTELSGARFGAFFYNVVDASGESFLLYTLSGAPREAFAKFGLPRNTPVFHPTFHGEGVVRVADITQDPRYGKMPPHHGMPKGHLPVRSYLAVPVISRSGEVIGGLFFGHPEPGIFTERSERLIVGVAAQAAIAIDNARLYEAAQREIVERKRAEEAMREAGERFRFLAESMPQKIFTATAGGDLDYFSRQWVEFTGQSEETLKKKGWLNLVHPEDAPETAQRWSRSVSSGQEFQMEHRVRSREGLYRWHLSRARAMRDAEGQIRIWVGSNTDIDDLRRIQIDLESANRAKDHFFAILSHELRTPLTPVLMSISLLQKHPGLPEGAVELLDRVERNVQLEAKLIDDLLDLTRITRNKLEYQFQPVCLNRCVQQAVEVCLSEIKNSGCELHLELDVSAPRVLADENRLQQVFWNLLKNALKFTPGGGTIRVATRHSNHEALIEVSDSGVGIEPQHFESIFAPFEQGAHGGSGGLGLGLAICKAAVEAHGGSISVASKGKGRGATFSIRLPLMAMSWTGDEAESDPDSSRT